MKMRKVPYVFGPPVKRGSNVKLHEVRNTSGQIENQPGTPPSRVTLNGVDCKGNPPKCPKNSGLGIILLCPDTS